MNNVIQIFDYEQDDLVCISNTTGMCFLIEKGSKKEDSQSLKSMMSVVKRSEYDLAQSMAVDKIKENRRVSNEKSRIFQRSRDESLVNETKYEC